MALGLKGQLPVWTAGARMNAGRADKQRTSESKLLSLLETCAVCSGELAGHVSKTSGR